MASKGDEELQMVKAIYAIMHAHKLDPWEVFQLSFNITLSTALQTIEENQSTSDIDTFVQHVEGSFTLALAKVKELHSRKQGHVH